MEKYIVIRQFQDKKDNKYFYEVGDIYPREGMETSEERIKELSTKKNKNKKIYIKKIKINESQEETKENIETESKETQEEKQDVEIKENKEIQDNTKVEE